MEIALKTTFPEISMKAAIVSSLSETDKLPAGHTVLLSTEETCNI